MSVFAPHSGRMAAQVSQVACSVSLLLWICSKGLHAQNNAWALELCYWWVGLARAILVLACPNFRFKILMSASDAVGSGGPCSG